MKKNVFKGALPEIRTVTRNSHFETMKYAREIFFTREVQ